MRDYTAEIAELEAAYRANRVANASISAEVRGKYRAIIADEIKRRRREADIEFAHHLASVKERSEMPLGVIQEHVFHTKSWDRWLYWRDLADIEPERVTRRNAREENRMANLSYRWEEADTDFGYVLVLMKDEQGNRIEPEAVITDLKVTVQNKLSAMPTVFGEDSHRAVWEKHWNGSGPDMQKYATRVANEHRGEIGK